jgi:hypothetical protein
MGEFVNYQKRGVELPPGCKDLVDVLREVSKSKTSQAITTQWVPVPKPEQIAAHGLDHIVRFMTRVLESTAKFTSLSIELPGREAAISVYRHREPGTLDLMLFVYRDTEEERAIRAFFEGHQVAPTVDYLPPPVTPTSVRGLQYPLPQNATAAANLIRDFLQRVHGLAEEAGIDFTFENHEPIA